MTRLRITTLVLAAAVLGCSAREVEEEGESRRHLAAQWCEDWCTFWYDCDPTYEGRPTDECRENCEADDDWDRTDICGDIRWEYRECKASMTCEEHLQAMDAEEVWPCQPIEGEYLLEDCNQ